MAFILSGPKGPEQHVRSHRIIVKMVVQMVISFIFYRFYISTIGNDIGLLPMKMLNKNIFY